MPIKLNIEKMHELALSRGGRCLSTAYTNVRTPLEWECKFGHSWKSPPDTVRNHWCPTCANIKVSQRASEQAQLLRLGLDKLQDVARSKGGRCLGTHYVNQRQILPWECAQGHTWKASAGNVYNSGSWCPTCARINSRKSVSKEEVEGVLQRLSLLLPGGHIERYTVTDKIAVSCCNGHISKITVSRFLKLQTYRCSECWKVAKAVAAGETLLRREQKAQQYQQKKQGKALLRLAKLARGEEIRARKLAEKLRSATARLEAKSAKISERMDALRTQVASKKGTVLTEQYDPRSMTFRCAADHQWSTSPSSILKGSWCQSCFDATRGQSRRRSLSSLTQLGAKSGLTLISDYADYRGVSNPVVWRCENGHTFSARPDNVKSGHRCPQCLPLIGEQVCRQAFEYIFKSSFPKVKPGWLINPLTRRTMELDGFCEELNLAFEYQGPHHYSNPDVIERDRRKVEICTTRGVTLIPIQAFKRKSDPSQSLIEVVQILKQYDLFPDVDVANFQPIIKVHKALEELHTLVRQQGGTTDVSTYLGAVAMFQVTCKNGHVFQTNVARIKRGAWCKECWEKRRKHLPVGEIVTRKLGRFMEILNEKRGVLLTDLNGKIRLSDKVSLKCLVCEEVWTPKIDNVVRLGTWCPNCGKAKSVNTRRKLQKRH